MNSRGFTLWFTGLPSSGKTTLSGRISEELRRRNFRVEVMDGDLIRQEICNMGFTREDRDQNVKRIGIICRLLSRNDVVAIAAAISPYREARRYVRDKIDDFVEVYVKCPVEVCAERDPKGNYKKAFAGEIKNFTGVDDPYEEPENAEIVVETDRLTVEEAVAAILRRLEELGCVEPAAEQGDGAYTEEEEEIVKKRLEDLGYI
ncbi:MAG: adenylyl-sulfate kinase [bacterium]